jgi:hypothetical protein
MNDDLVKALDTMTTANQLSTQINKVLPEAPPVPAIPPRVGSGQPGRVAPSA